MSLVTMDRIAGMNCHYRFYTLEDFFAGLQRNGITHAELWSCASHFRLGESSWQDTKEVKRLAAQYGITIICLTPEQNNPKPYNLATRDPELKKRTHSYFNNAIRAASELNCALISVSSGWSFFSEPTEDAWQRAVAMLHDLAEEAHRCGVTLAMESLLPRETRLVRTLKEEQQMLAEVDSAGLKVNLDTGSMAVAGETIQQWFDVFGKEIVHCHFVDGRPSGHLAWGEGTRDPGKDLADFAKNNYHGYFTLELLSQDYYEKPWKAEEKSLQTLRPWLE